MITKFEDLDLTKQYSYADYLTWQFQERLELIKGYVYKMSPAPARKHQQIVWNVSGVFWEKFKKGPCKVYQAPTDEDTLVSRAFPDFEIELSRVFD